MCADATFNFLTTMQRTTIQAYLASPHSIREVFTGPLADPTVKTFVVYAARFYVVVVSSVGSVLLDILGPTLLGAGNVDGRCDASSAAEEQMVVEGWTNRQRMMSGNSTVLPRKYFRIGLLSEGGAVIQSHACPALPLKEAILKLAKAYSVDARIFAEMLHKHAEGTGEGEEDAVESSLLASSVPSGYASVRQMNMATGLDETAFSPTNRMATSPWHTAGTSSAFSTTGAWSYVKSRTTVRRLAQERLLTPRAFFEADGLIAMTHEIKLSDAGTDLPVRL